MEAVPDHWKPRLASALAAAIRESRQVLGSEPIVCLDIGCFPWHGGFELSALTTTEFAADPAVMGPREVACWRFYNISEGLTAWAATAELGTQMSEAYYAAEDDTRVATANAFIRVCAEAAATPGVQDAASTLQLDPRFRIRVAHPDSGLVYEPPVG